MRSNVALLDNMGCVFEPSYLRIYLLEKASIVNKNSYEWIHSGYNEIQRPRQRYGIIDFKNLMALLQIENFTDLKEAHREWIEEALKKSKVVRERKWTQSIAAGDKSFLEKIKDRFGIRAKGRKIHGSEDEYQLREGHADYGDWQDFPIIFFQFSVVLLGYIVHWLPCFFLYPQSHHRPGKVIL
jgi:hypothetical protein